MPRKSAASLAVLPRVHGSPSRLQPRSDAPATLKRIIVDLIASVPSTHFRPGDYHLVEQYAQSIALAREAFDELQRHGRVINGKASPWIIILEKAHRSSVALSARLRLAPQQREDKKTAGREDRRPLSYYEEMDLRDDDDNAISR